MMPPRALNEMEKVIPLTPVADCTLVAEAQKELNMH